MLRVQKTHFFNGVTGGVIISLGLISGLFMAIELYVTNPVVINLVYKLTLIVIIHQILVWFVWRSQLCFNLISRIFGKQDLKAWTTIFLPLLAARPVLSLLIGINDYGSLPGSRTLHIGLGILLLIPAIYSSYSVIKYFGVYRAVGGDHFRPEYREKGKIKKGMYRFSSNVMYTYVFLIFWAIPLFTSSLAGIIVALFQHALIWVHYFAVEAPDMEVIYDKRG